jgi:hypothetical protein
MWVWFSLRGGWPHASLLLVVIFPLAPHEPGWFFCYPLVCSSGDRFLPTTKLWSFCSLRLNSVVAVFLLVLKLQSLFICFVFASFSSCFSRLEGWRWFWGVTLACVSDSFWARSTTFCRRPCDTTCSTVLFIVFIVFDNYGVL